MARPRTTTRPDSGKPCIDCVSEGTTSKRKTPWPGPRCATHHRAKRFDRKNYSHSKHIQEMYGITAEEYQAIYEHQGGRCYICQRATGAKRKLSVDHSHETGQVRGLLCVSCNRNVLGHSRDEVDFFDRAIRYLKSPPAEEVIGWRRVPLTGAPVRGATPKGAGAKLTTTDGGGAT